MFYICRVIGAGGVFAKFSTVDTQKITQLTNSIYRTFFFSSSPPLFLVHLMLCKNQGITCVFLAVNMVRVYKRIIGTCAALICLAGGGTLEYHILFIFVNLLIKSQDCFWNLFQFFDCCLWNVKSEYNDSRKKYVFGKKRSWISYCYIDN